MPVFLATLAMVFCASEDVESRAFSAAKSVELVVCSTVVRTVRAFALIPAGGKAAFRLFVLGIAWTSIVQL